MPEMDGLEFLEIIRKERNNDIPFIIFTGRGREEVAIEALNLGANRYLQKGGDPKSQYGVLARAIVQEVKRSQLEERRDFFRISASKAPEAIFVSDRNANVIYVNEKASNTLGYSIEELENMKIFDFDLNFSSENWNERWMEVTNKQRHRVQTEHIRKDGKKFPVELLINHVSHRGEEYNFTFARDITERKEKELELERSRRKYRQVPETAQEIILTHKMDGSITFANSSAAEKTGYSKGKLEDMNVFELIPEEEIEKIQELRSKREEGNLSDIRFESKLQRKDNTTFPAEISCGILGTQEEEKEFLVVARDTTERKKMEKKLRESEQRYRIVTEGSSNGIYVFQDGKFKFVNEGLVELSGYPREELKNMHFLELIHPDHRADIKRWTEQALTGDTSGLPEKAEVEALKKDGESVWVQITPKLVEYEGKPAIVGNVADINERKKAEEREEFLHSILRHDVRNKAQIVLGYLELLSEADLSGKYGRSLENAKRATSEGVELIGKIKEIKEIEKKRRVGKVNVGPIINEIVDSLESQASEKEIEIRYEEFECEVKGGPLLEELFSNLVENSIKHSGGNLIRISYVEEKDECIIIVEDDGGGIPDNFKDKIFDKAFKSGPNAGLGLGLSFVKKIVEGYGGSVVVKDSELGGARFDVHLKRA